MTLALAFLLLLVTVPLAGGRLSSLEELRLRWVWLVVLAFAIQVVLVTVAPEGDETLHRMAHLATYALAGVCILRNLDLRFMWVVAVGGALKARGALSAAGLDVKTGSFANSDLVENAHVGFLGDVFAIPAGWPGANVFSVGDAVMVLGAFLVLHAAAGSRLGAATRTARPRAQGSPAAPRR